MKRIFLLSVALITMSSSLRAQQDPQFTHNMFNKLATNAGYAGTSGAICGNIIGRQQWTGFPGAPKTALLSFDMPVLQGSPLHGGAGATVFADQAGAEKTINFKGAYSYHISLGTGKLGIGLELGALNKNVSNTWVTPSGDNGSTDPSIMQAAVSSTVFDAGLGVFYTNDKLFAGISTTHIPASQIKDASSGKSFKYVIARHYYVTAGYNYSISSNVMLRPTLFIKTDASSTQLDFNVNALFNNMFWVGATYRLTDAIAGMAGVQFNNFKVGYSYDYTTSYLNKSKGGASSGTHEIMLSYCFKPKNAGAVQKSRTVRFL